MVDYSPGNNPYIRDLVMIQAANLISTPDMNSIQVPPSKLQLLAQQVSQKLLQQKPVSAGYLTGEEIRSFAQHQQVNSFLLFQIFQVWDQRVQQLQHPYFNVEAEEVQEVLSQLKSQLAHHIRIDADSFTDLLERAVSNCLSFIFAPKDSFKSFFFTQQDPLPLDQFERYAQFFSDWDFGVNSILKYYQKHQDQPITWAGFSEKLDRVVEIYEQKKGQPIKQYRQQLYSSLTGEDLDSIIGELEAARAAEEASRMAAEAEARRIAQEEEARKRAEEARLREEAEQARLRAEAAAAQRRAEEERARLEAERIAREEEAERLRKEEEAKRKTIFDDLGGGSSLDLDLDLDEEVVAAPVRASEPSPTPMSSPAPLAREEEAPAQPAEEPVAPMPLPAANSGEDEFQEMIASLEPVEKKPQPVFPATASTGNGNGNGNETFLDKFKARQEKQEEIKAKAEEVEEKGASILDKIQERSQTIADRFSEQSRQRKLHESLNGNQKIKLDEIPIHRQYQYVQKVFGGNNVRFRIIVDRVNDARDAAEVEDILNKFVLSIDDIDREDAVVVEFMELLRRRF